MAKETSKATEARPAAVPRQDPARDVVSLRDTINGLFEDFFNGRPLLASGFLSAGGEQAWTPPVDIVDKENEVIVYAGLPGVKKEDCRLEVKDDVLILSGECKAAASAEGLVREELPDGPFYRAFTLPAGIEPAGVKASCHDGLLEIRLPKSEAARSRKVEIQ
jgi:HSP20 family protein